MSTYGADKRRPQQDRYFEGDDIFRASFNDRSMKTQNEYSESNVKERNVFSNRSTRPQIIGTAGRATIAK